MKMIGVFTETEMTKGVHWFRCWKSALAYAATAEVNGVRIRELLEVERGDGK